MSTSTISKAEEHSRMKDLDETFEEKYAFIIIFICFYNQEQFVHDDIFLIADIPS